MKVYYDAGLKELAESSGHRGETFTSIQKCSSFKRTHQFLVHVWEAVYHQMFQIFVCECDSDTLSISDVLSAAMADMLACNDGDGEGNTADIVKSFFSEK